ncbi:hypothetical protein JAAARDRAFT_181752 [Jaapia argillacea MUCL 33604]|uniref:Uncharacterized protein n=1 Tax=Jaapia argillacea MUCL 33604 TaxID=933084 RepID=A0A067PMC6_9AGAM|nr:hypothetical protein JAAARDRAFT_181752 [Jaapia argillacea MUCL 33604]
MHSLGTLLPGSQPDSPGSSIFDLPTRPRPPRLSTILSPDGRGHKTDLVEPPVKEDNSKASYLVISGGTGCNSICSAFGNACYVLPVSDDGGSSSEIIRVMGGPSIGDIRSRLIRLIPPAPRGSPLEAIRILLSHRFPAHCSEREARDEWRDIVEGKSLLWSGIPSDRKELIRGFLVYFENELLKRAHKSFSFRNGRFVTAFHCQAHWYNALSIFSVGNYFLAAVQEFFRSLPSAIFLFASITNSQADILPVIVTNHTVTIAAELENGRKLVGQCNISHPVPSGPSINVTDSDPGSPMIFHQANVMFEQTSKDGIEALESPISRLYYINAYGHEIQPGPNPDYISSLSTKDILVYSCGSLWTSIIPCLALRGVAAAIAGSHSLRAKVLLLNAKNDRETDGYDAADYISAIIGSLTSSGTSSPLVPLSVYPISAFITHLVYLKGTTVPVDVEHITSLGVRCVEVRGDENCLKDGPPRFDAASVRWAIDEILAEDGSRSD